VVAPHLELQEVDHVSDYCNGCDLAEAAVYEEMEIIEVASLPEQQCHAHACDEYLYIIYLSKVH
jgi:hypothetical protein